MQCISGVLSYLFFHNEIDARFGVGISPKERILETTEYQLNIKLTLRSPIVKEYVRMMVDSAVKNMNVSVLMGQEEKPESVEVSIRK